MTALRFIVPFGRDGAADRAARAVAASVACDIENIPGDGGLAGIHRANALAAAGEPTLLLATPTTHILLPSRLGPSAAADRAFKPVLGLGSAPNVLLVPAKLGIRTIEALVDLARREPLVYASAGTGQTIHVCSALFCAQAGIAMTHRPYELGSAAAYDDLAQGRVQVYFDNLLACGDAIAYGHLIPLAVSSRHRHAALAHVPTLRECGLDHALDVWMAVFGAHLGAGEESIAALAGSKTLERALAQLGLSGGPQAGTAAAAEVERSAPAWGRALEAAFG